MATLPLQRRGIRLSSLIELLDNHMYKNEQPSCNLCNIAKDKLGKKCSICMDMKLQSKRAKKSNDLLYSDYFMDAEKAPPVKASKFAVISCNRNAFSI